MRGNRMGPSALSGLRPGPHGGCAPATPSERLKNLSLKAKNKGGLAASFAPAFRLILRLENAAGGLFFLGPFLPGAPFLSGGPFGGLLVVVRRN